MDTNILVIGSGISGLTYAIKMAEQNPSLEIVMISKNSLLESNTRYAQGGIAVVSNFQKDSFDKHVEDTLIAGAGECDREVVEFVVKEGHERLQELIDWGTHFDKQKNGVRGEVVGHATSGDPYLCPCRALGRRMLHLRDNNAPPNTPLACAYINAGTPKSVRPAAITDTIRLAVRFI